MLFACFVGVNHLIQIFCADVFGRKNITFIPPNENNLARISDATAIYSPVQTQAVRLYLTRNRNKTPQTSQGWLKTSISVKMQ